MPSHVFHQLYYHIVWGTKNRLPLVAEDMRERLIRWVEDECRKRKGTSLACNAMPDHVHLFVHLPPTVCVSTFIGQVKGASSYAYNHHMGAQDELKWQDGYGVITARKTESEKIIRYITNQQELHARRETLRVLEATEIKESLTACP